MKPSPPKKPLPRRLLKAISTLVPKAAHKKESFWQVISPPISARFMATTEPGKGAAKATCFLPNPSLVKCVINNDSPVSIRFPAENNFPIKPWFTSEPSPIFASKLIPSSI